MTSCHDIVSTLSISVIFGGHGITRSNESLKNQENKKVYNFAENYLLRGVWEGFGDKPRSGSLDQ